MNYNPERSERNLDAYADVSEDLTEGQRRALAMHIIGGLAGHVTDEVWNNCLAEARKWAEVVA